MHHLASIDNKSRRLPLADSTLLRLAEAVLCDDASQRKESLQQAILDDPALALWCVCNAWSREQQCLELVGDVTDWLAGKGLKHIVAEAESVSEQNCAVDWSACVRESMARRVNAEEAPDTSGQIQFQAMLSNIRQWRQLIAAGEDHSEYSIGPAWLCDLDIGENQSSAASKHVAKLLAAWESDQPMALTLFHRAMAMRQQFDALQQHWDETFLREKLASLKEFTYGASHELNNPLFNISSRAQVLLRDEKDPERRRKLSTIYAHAMRASDMINDIALAARVPHPKFVAIDVVAVVGEVVAELQSAAEEQATLLAFDPPLESLTIDADAAQLAVAVREVIINALESLKRSTRRGEVTVAIRAADDGDAEISIADNGPGLDARAKRHLFDPFFSGYESGRGLGFGLTKCWQIMEAHGGAIVVDSQPQRGMTFTLQIPAKQPLADAPAVGAIHHAESGT